MRGSVSVECLGQSLRATVGSLGNDVCVTVTGGEGHIGSVSVAIPRPSLSESGKHSATVSTFNVTGHLDDVIGDAFAKRIASKLRCRVAVICGVHFDDFTPGMADEVQEAANRLLDEVENLLMKPRAGDAG
jgi:hypothetical protein